MKRVLYAVAVSLLLLSPGRADAVGRSVEVIKADILAMARSFAGQGDPDFSRQRALDVLVNELLAAAPPQLPASERLDLLKGPWRQVWGKYDYTGDERGIDPKLDLDNIYQVVFADGYYYNAVPYKGRRGDYIAMLRGEYSFVEGYPEMIRGKFTEFPANRGLPEGMEIWELPALAEADELPDGAAIVPSFIVWLFFDAGYLREVYTDEDMRINYGGDSLTDRSDEYLYILERPQ